MIDWGPVNKPISADRFQAMLDRAASYLQGREIFVADLWAGADPTYRLPVRIITECAWHNLFARNMFIRPPADALQGFEPGFTVLQVPGLEARGEADGLNSQTFILVDFNRRIVLIGGSSYAGEIKKSIFTVLNHLLPDRGDADALLGEHRLPWRCCDLLRPFGDRQDDALRRRHAHADRR